LDMLAAFLLPPFRLAELRIRMLARACSSLTLIRLDPSAHDANAFLLGDVSDKGAFVGFLGLKSLLLRDDGVIIISLAIADGEEVGLDFGLTALLLSLELSEASSGTAPEELLPPEDGEAGR